MRLSKRGSYRYLKHRRHRGMPREAKEVHHSLTVSRMLRAFQIVVRVWMGIFGSLLISSKIRTAEAALTTGSSFSFNSASFASVAARLIFLGTEVSSAMRAIISATCFNLASDDDNVTTCDHGQSTNYNRASKIKMWADQPWKRKTLKKWPNCS